MNVLVSFSCRSVLPLEFCANSSVEGGLTLQIGARECEESQPLRLDCKVRDTRVSISSQAAGHRDIFIQGIY